MTQASPLYRAVFLVACCCAGLAWPAEKAGPLTSDESASLLAQVEFPGEPRIHDGYMEPSDGSIFGLAYVDFLPRRIGEGDCVGHRVTFQGRGATRSQVTWRAVEQTYVYWPSPSDCADRDLAGSIRLRSTVDSDSLARIIEDAPNILRRANEYLNARSKRTDARSVGVLSDIGIQYDDKSKTYLHNVGFEVDACHRVTANIRLLENIEVVDAWDIVC